MKANNLGFMLLEIVIAVAIISIAFISLLGVGFLVLNASHSIKEEIHANSLIKEGFESLRNFRDGTQWETNGLGVVNTGSLNPYHLVNSSGQWTLVAGQEVINTSLGAFTRYIIFDKVSRDQITQNVEETYNATNDKNDTKKITVIVSWPGRTLQIISYLVNWKND